MTDDTDARPFRERYPGPYRFEQTPSGCCVMAGKVALAYVYVHAKSWQTSATTGEHRLNWAEGLALAKAIAGLGGETVEEFRDRQVEARAALRMIRDVVEQLAPPGSVVSEERIESPLAHEAEALIKGIEAIADEAKRRE